ncbi:MAG: hypothetical protein WCG26_02805, partial [Chloroflexales bacterium]
GCEGRLRGLAEPAKAGFADKRVGDVSPPDSTTSGEPRLDATLTTWRSTCTAGRARNPVYVSQPTAVAGRYCFVTRQPVLTSSWQPLTEGKLLRTVPSAVVSEMKVPLIIKP